ncbi:hypothetical protein [Amycolatopsis saalfeldensis]|uniref:Uncharacterized protein n=1 Tax=Amycolatopsis saalfeldensis TaxID=394193 RepID=A0A1H8Y919_9PSEU|nr:hypothetical protein [Amycolatopsis saalfeldensis]SEP48645.1 hypothetical protein SAMN04489732_11297 [Amycolatopsis saalfeldensis]
MLALILAVAAGVCLGLGWLLGQVVLVYVALGLSVVGFVLVLGQALRRRKSARAAKAADAEAEIEDGDGTDAEQPDDAAAEDGEVVFVVPGRMRFHVAGCRLLEGKNAEQLTLEEAEDEAFTACTVCASHEAAELAVG